MQPSDAVQSDQMGAPFIERHIGPNPDELAKMLATVGYDSLEALIDDAVPATILKRRAPSLPEPLDEPGLYRELGAIAAENRPLRSLIGLGYYDTVMPAVIRRNLLENPGWYTAYTPYQPEISQGRLEALLVFQTMVTDLTGLAIANASLLDEATACVEAMMICRRTTAGERFFVDAGVFPQTLAVLETRARAVGAELVVADLAAGLPEGECFGVLVQIPAADGTVRDLAPLVEAAHGRGAPVVVATDLLALTLLRPPGADGADIAVGSAQRFGMSLGFGGPHAGFLAARAELARSLPGRIVGVSRDAAGREALQLALQTREQHIRREKATSNICTAEVLPAVIAAMYAVYHGPDGLRAIARRVHRRAIAFAGALSGAGIEVGTAPRFDTVTARVPGKAAAVAAEALARGINVRVVDADRVAVAFDERSDQAEHDVLVESVAAALGFAAPASSQAEGVGAIPAALGREGDLLTHAVFHRYHSETALMRLLRTFSDRDLALDRTMIPLGSCTMKLNSAIEMEPVTWAGFAGLHPFAPADQSLGYRRVITDLEAWLGEITGFDAVSLQPNAGSQGELAGLLAIRAHHERHGEPDRRVCLIPSSAHGTNPASAQLAGFEVVVVACDVNGNVDLGDLDAKIAAHGERLAALMITYPSTHGVYEREVRTICDAVHRAGGQVYLDGANLNALIGLARPGDLGADACHINLHKTFCIPHGGGGPGVGPLAVKSHLAPFLPGHPLVDTRHGEPQAGAVAAAPFGSAGILPIPWAYIRMMGGEGLLRATEVAVLSANYVVRRLAACYPVLYAGERGLVAHECVLDLRPLRETAGVSVEDVAKRLIDYGFHAPTMSFPVAGTLMIEPTESENLDELDRFCDAMIAIREEIAKIESGEWPREDNPLVNAPHTADELAAEWAHPYSREQAVYPLPSVRHSWDRNKYWPPIKRVNQAFGDRNPSCTCPPLSDYSGS